MLGGTVMLPSARPNFIKRLLTQDDIDGHNQLYPRPAGAALQLLLDRLIGPGPQLNLPLLDQG